MQAREFIDAVGDCFERWLRILAVEISKGRLTFDGPHSFASGLRIASSPHHFVAELVGSTHMEHPDGLVLTRPNRPERVPNTSAFFSPGFHVDDSQTSALRIAREGGAFVNLTLCTAYDKAVFEKKIGSPLRGPSLCNPCAEVPLVILPSADHLIFQNINIVRADRYRVMYRTVPTAVVVRHGVSRDYFTIELPREFGKSLREGHPLPGVNVGYDRRSGVFAEQLLSLADQDVHELVIDRFIRQHADCFAKALGYGRALAQVKLKWVRRTEGDPKESTPDYLMQRDDGYFDILDLKRGLLLRPVVKGKPGRLRFTDYVSELIAQLNGYRRYFATERNREWALRKRAVRVSNPRLIGIVGNYDTFERDRVERVCQRYQDHIVLLSYSDVVDLLRASPRAWPGSRGESGCERGG